MAQQQQDPLLLLAAYFELGAALFCRGEFTQAQEHFEQGIALYDPDKHRSHAFLYGYDLGVASLSRITRVLWPLGYPDQALQKGQQALALAKEESHPFSQAYALNFVAECHRLRGELPRAQELAEAAITLSTEQGFPLWATTATMLRGWLLAEQGRGAEGIAQMLQGLTAWRTMGAQMALPYWLGLLAEAHGKAAQTEEGLFFLTEALATADKTGEREFEAELYRLKGELFLQSTVQGQESKVQEEAEGYFRQAIDVAHHQNAKSLELRAVMSLGRLWQKLGKKDKAHQMLAEIYDWFTEGFDTTDLQEAKALLEEVL
jgi:predicted ATPase